MIYYKRIDGLRFLAIFCVLIQHFAWSIAQHTNLGWFGVDLFFVISGFLITSILLRNKHETVGASYRRFIGRRTLRIFPIYYIAIVILWALGLETVTENLFYFLTYTFNYAMVDKNIAPGIVNHFWSLSVEEQFYVFWPLLVLTLREHLNKLLVMIAAIILLGLAQAFFNVIPSLTKYNDVGLLTRMSSLGIGSLGVVLVVKKALPAEVFKNKWLEYFMVILLFVSVSIKSDPIKLFILPICSLYLVLKAARYDFKIRLLDKIFCNKWIVYVGTLSYGIYIFHVPIDYFFTRYIFNVVWSLINFEAIGNVSFFSSVSWAIKFPFSVFLSILVASLSYRFIEAPILKYKDKLFGHQLKKDLATSPVLK